MKKSLQKRFEEKIERVPECGCWIWTGACDGAGYGQIRINGVIKRAHRLAWELYRGPIPSGMDGLHCCDTPACVNPYHLFLGTHQQNMQNCSDKNRIKWPGLKGEFHANAKLCDEDILKIRSDSRPQGAIAKDFGVSQTHISEIKLKKCWSHIK